MRPRDRTRGANGRWVRRPVQLGLWKVCSTCEVEQPLAEFGRCSRLTDGLRSQCKSCESRARKDYYRRHGDRARARTQEWRRANPEYLREQWLVFSHSEHGRAWLRRYWRDRHARKKAATVGSVDLEAVIAEHGMVCHICGDDIEAGDLQFDHVIPLARGGPHAQENLKPSHASCNASKGAKLMEELAA